MQSSSLRVAVVCYSNMNRIMEANRFLKKQGFHVNSFGVATEVRLRGSTRDTPNVYDYRTTYAHMYNDLLKKDRDLYRRKGILHIWVRNQLIKLQPERFQKSEEFFDVIFTCEEWVYDKIVEHLISRDQTTYQPLHVINVDILYTLEEASLGAFFISEICQCMQLTEDLENDLDELLQEFEEQLNRPLLHTVCFY